MCIEDMVTCMGFGYILEEEDLALKGRVLSPTSGGINQHAIGE
jgi:hypothetical protein